MGYNKAKEEQKWLKWKQAEEQQLRQLGVDEAIITRLHEYDWVQFNKERQYRQRQIEWSGYIDWYSAQILELPIKDVDSLMDEIENSELWTTLSKENRLTLEIVFLRIMGYNGFEISEKIGISQKAVNLRLVRLRKKLKKF